MRSFLSGLNYHFIGIFLFISLSKFSILTNPDPQPAINDLKILFVTVGLGIFVDLLILTEAKFVLFPAALVSAGGVVLLLSMVYTILWIRVLQKENQFTRLSQITRYGVVGFMMTITQIALFDLTRFIITGNWNGLIFI